jgi:hypothetical protein
MSRDINALSASSSSRVQQSAQTNGSSQRDTLDTLSNEFLWTQTLKTIDTQAVQAAQSVGQFASQSLKIA